MYKIIIFKIAITLVLVVVFRVLVWVVYLIPFLIKPIIDVIAKRTTMMYKIFKVRKILLANVILSIKIIECSLNC